MAIESAHVNLKANFSLLEQIRSFLKSSMW